ncbi:hypothetical protein EDC94DRAFT_603442 [Helicostylum pulchrum]|nr:hypothetical protein EDC94DRAFT_603442 [Helicostylum pulchrum]
MVATQARRSAAGSMGQASTKSRKRSSLRRQSERPPSTKERSRSVSAGTSQHLLQPRLSAPAVVEIPRLSIADRFMSGPVVSSPQQQPQQPPTPPQQQQQPSPSQSVTTSLVLSNSTSITDNGRLSVADRFMNHSNSVSHSSIQQYRERSASMLDPVPGRLTIAEAFMKSASAKSLRSRAASFGGVGENVHHPLEERNGLFEDAQYLNLDLSISPSSSSVLDRHKSARPWGSQDTLVHHYHTERKKPIYAQFIESEKNAVLADNQSFDYSSYFLDSGDDKRTVTMSDDFSTKYDDYDDMEIGYDKKYGHQRQWSYEEEEEEQEEEQVVVVEPIPSPAVSTTKLKKQQPAAAPHQHIDIEPHHLEDYDHNTKGFWVGCCFVSCGQRPSRKTIEQRHKKRREKEIDEDIRPKNRGFGRRGWVFCTFLSLLVLILVTYFLWPRTPLMRIEGASLTSPAKVTETRQGVMVGNVAFESEWMVNITVDNRQNHVPTRLVQVQVLAKDALTGLVIGKGLHNDDANPEHIILAPNAISTVQIPIHVDYQARDSTDTTFVDLTKACSPPIPFRSPDSSSNNQREALPLHFWITLHFFGLDWLGYKPTVIATPATGGFACPQS